MILQSLFQVGWPSMVARFVSIRALGHLRPPLLMNLEKSNYYTYVWAVENVNMFYHKSIKSPYFVVPFFDEENESIVKRKYCLKLCLQHKDDLGLMYFKLLRKAGDEYFEVEDKDYELSILDAEGSSLIKKEFIFSNDYKGDLMDKMKIWKRVFVPRDEVFVQRKSKFLPNNTLTLQCKMTSEEEAHYFARTRLRIEKVAMPFLIEDICYSDISLQYAQEVRPNFFRNSKVDAEIFCSSCCEEKLKVKLRSYFSREDQSYDDGIKCSKHYELRNNPEEDWDEKERDGDYRRDAIDCYTCKIFLIDALRKEECILDETRFKFNKRNSDYAEPEIITLPLTRKMLMEKASKYLTNGALSLNCLFTFYSCASMKEIAFTKYGNSDLQNYSSISTNEAKDENAPTLKDSIRSLFDDQIFCDFTIKTETKSFPVHKIILVSRSPIFQSMMANCVKQDLYIPGVDSETMHRFLLYIYTDKMEGMEWENALKLYAVAEQFKVAPLIKKCSLMVTEKLTTQNVCDILLFAYNNNHENMKSLIRNFISEHDVVIFNSDEWIKMEETNSIIAVETLRLCNLKK